MNIFTAVHQLKVDDQRVPGISTSFFFEDFNNPKDDENTKVEEFLRVLSALNIGAYLCHSQHMVVIGAYDGHKITPEGLGQLFVCEPGIKKAVDKALSNTATKKWNGLTGYWLQEYIARFYPDSQG